MAEMTKTDPIFDVDYLGQMTLSEISKPGSGFSDHQCTLVALLEVGEIRELLSTDCPFNIKRIS